MSLLADGKPWRNKHLVERVGADLKPAAVHHQLEVLRNEGRIFKPRIGVWMLAGMAEPSAEEIPPLRVAPFGGPTGRKVWDRLSGAISAPALVKELGVTRQRIDQILKAALKQEIVTRIHEAGARRRWLWIRSDIYAKGSYHQPLVTVRRVTVLSVLEPDAFHCIDDVAVAVGESDPSVRKHIRELEARSLVVSVRLGRRRYVGITPSGIDDPSRSPSAARAPVADMSDAFGDKRIACLEALAVLGQAPTIDVTAALVSLHRPGNDMTSSRAIAHLMKGHLAEFAPGNSVYRPAFRLTEAGRLAAALFARHRTPPGKAQIEARIAAFQGHRKQRLQESALRRKATGAGKGSRAHRAILKALANGPLSSDTLVQVIVDLGRKPRSIALMLKTLTDRGAIRPVGKRDRWKVWSLVDAPG
jgi:DNA-binding transcriptional ArsR family regulator